MAAWEFKDWLTRCPSGVQRPTNVVNCRKVSHMHHLTTFSNVLIIHIVFYSNKCTDFITIKKPRNDKKTLFRKNLS